MGNKNAVPAKVEPPINKIIRVHRKEGFCALENFNNYKEREKELPLTLNLHIFGKHLPKEVHLLIFTFILAGDEFQIGNRECKVTTQHPCSTFAWFANTFAASCRWMSCGATITNPTRD